VANELELNISYVFRDGDVEIDNSSEDPTYVDVVTPTYITSIMSVGTTAEAIPLGDVATPGFGYFRNLDETNFVDLYVSNGGSRFARLYPGEPFLGRLGPDVTAPYIKADTAACRVEYALFSV